MHERQKTGIVIAGAECMKSKDYMHKKQKCPASFCDAGHKRVIINFLRFLLQSTHFFVLINMFFRYD